MKTIKTKLLATIVTLAAIISTATIPANAQRRSSERNTAQAEKSNRSRENTIQNKSTFKSYDTKPNSTSVSTNRNSRTVQRNSAPQANDKRKSTKPSVVTKSTQPANRRSTSVYRTPATSNRIKSSASNQNRVDSQEPSVKTQARERVVRNQTSVNTNRTSNRSEIRNRSEKATVLNESSRNEVRSATRNRNAEPRDFYRHNLNDTRYTPNKNYRGNNTVWTNNYRPQKMNYNYNDRNFYRNYNYKNYKHWDKNWERYRWNHNSWRDYYYGYNPYSYKYHRYYYHHPSWGHVIRKWTVRPHIFIHNHHKYYCYNGHFFRYRPGIGYVLADMPYGLVFDYLPHGYERVYINGYLYFRVGNLFFEYSRFGFRLVHYPERYFALNDAYYNEGYRFNDYYYDNDYY